MLNVISLSSIEMDTGIQCRASINTETVNDYAERMTAADEFPPVDLFGRDDQFWIGDGWHRIMAARQIGALSIAAEVHEGGRQDALKHALAANAKHGHRRTNADKRRCVEIAIAEFSTLSGRAIAELCGVGHHLVIGIKQALGETPNAQVTTTDGRQYPAKRQPKVEEEANPPQGPLKRNTSRDDVAKTVKGMLAAGHNIEQVSDAIGREIGTVRGIIRDYDIAKLTHRGRNTAKISPVRVIQETINAVAATSHGLRMIRGATVELSKTEAGALLAELRDAMKSLQWLANILKEKTNG